MVPICAFLLVLLTASEPVAGDIQVHNVTSESLGDGRLYRAKYSSSLFPRVIWYENDIPSNPVERQITNTLVGGVWESTLSTTEESEYVMLEIYHPSGYELVNVLFSGDLEKDIDIVLPETELELPQGRLIQYSPGVPFNISVRYSRESGDFGEPSINWYFLAVDRESENTSLEIYSSFMPVNDLPFNMSGSIVPNGQYYDVPVRLTLQSLEGAGVFYTSYPSRTEPGVSYLTLDVILITKAGNDQLYPNGFIGIFNVYETIGTNTIPCWSDRCPVMCNAVGEDVERIEVTKTGSDTLEEQVDEMFDAVISSATYVVPKPKEQSESYTCRVYNSNGDFAEKVFIVGNQVSPF